MKTILKYALILYFLIGALVGGVITANIGIVPGILSGLFWLPALIYGLFIQD